MIDNETQRFDLILKVIETKAGKWVRINGVVVEYTTDSETATLFTRRELAEANEYFTDFSLYYNTLRVIEVGRSGRVFSFTEYSLTVREYLANPKV